MRIEGLDTLILGGGATTPCVYIVMAFGDRLAGGGLRWVFADRLAAEAKADELGGGAYVDTVAVDTSEADAGEEQ
tara:strand:- start:6179 stop:6403 length:225 start_codon:yes stop_codon:yes gene_type:complete